MADGNRYVPQTKVNWSANDAYQQFRLWRKEVERIINGPMAKDSDSIKLNTTYIWAGAYAETMVEARQAEDASLKIENVEQLLNCLSQCLTHKTFYREAREEFYKLKQSPDENTTRFYSRVIELYKLAEFPEGSEFLVVDKLIHGCTNIDCKRKLMACDKSIDIKKCLEYLRRFESVDVTMSRLQEQSVDTTCNKVHAKGYHNKRQHNLTGERSRNKNICQWCNGESHPRSKCPAKNANCNFCHKIGHYEKACRLKKRPGFTKQIQNAIRDSDSDDTHSTHEDQDEPFLDIGVLGNETSKPREVLADITFHTKRPATLQGKVDTGAMVTCMPSSMLVDIGVKLSDLQPSNAKLRGVTGADLKTCGELTLRASCNGHTCKIRVVITELGSELILGLETCKVFRLITIATTCIQREITEHVEAVHIMDEAELNYVPLKQKWKKHLPLGKVTGDPLEDLKSIFPDMFDGSVGLFEGEVDLKVSPEAKPIQLSPRAVPVSIMSKLKSQLDKMEEEGIIRACPETTEWVHNVVIVSKKNGDIRICLDPRNLNKYLIRNVHYTASWQDVQYSFKNGKYFSTLDAKSGYWTKKLSEKSQLLTAFNTPFKKYCFVRMPFGLSVSSEIFCEQMDRVLSGIPGTFPCADDVKIQGSTEEHHDIHLLETVSKAMAAGIKFNPQKCQIKKDKIEYFGRVVSRKGVEPCQQKVKAIVSLQPPTNKQELQSLLGTVNFMATFIPNLSKKTHMMRGLLKKNVHFAWTSDMEREFVSIKEAIASAVRLVHFDPSQPSVIETDASLKGLGAVLLQNGKPVKFISKSLTKAESDYSNIERELLAVLYACEKLHIYIYGQTVTIHTDHQPLETIFRKPISLASPRLQRMLLRLRIYDLQVKYVGANRVLVADTLSRLLTPETDPAIKNLDITIAQVLAIGSVKLKSLQFETKQDATLKALKELIVQGWPDSMQDVPKIIHPYWCFRDELTMLDGLIMKGSRVVVPAALQRETLKRLHEGHQGLTATLQRARRTVYWPKLQDDISAVIHRCNECQIHANKKHRVPERQVSASRPMEIIGVDLFEFKNKSALVTVDYYSGFLTIDAVISQTSDAIIKVFNNNFRKFGLAQRIISDNAACFTSEKFRNFCVDLEIDHTTSSPHYHEGNGRAERAIQTLRQILNKSKSDLEVTNAVLAYLDTPISNDIPSPAELFYNRRINTSLGMMFEPTMLSDTQKVKLSERRAAHLHTPSIKEEYFVDQPIWFTEDGSPEWKAGQIESKDTQPDSYWVINKESTRRIRRNIHDLKPRIQPQIPANKSRDQQRENPLPTVETDDYDIPSHDSSKGSSQMLPSKEEEVLLPSCEFNHQKRR